MSSCCGVAKNGGCCLPFGECTADHECGWPLFAAKLCCVWLCESARSCVRGGVDCVDRNGDGGVVTAVGDIGGLRDCKEDGDGSDDNLLARGDISVIMDGGSDMVVMLIRLYYFSMLQDKVYVRINLYGMRLTRCNNRVHAEEDDDASNSTSLHMMRSARGARRKGTSSSVVGSTFSVPFAQHYSSNNISLQL